MLFPHSSASRCSNSSGKAETDGERRTPLFRAKSSEQGSSLYDRLPPNHHNRAANRRHGDDAEFQHGHGGEVGAFGAEPGANHEAGEGLEKDGEVEVAGY